MSPLFRLQGLEPAIADLKAFLAQAFAAEPDLKSVLSTEGMLSVRFRKPTDGSISTKISNHAWGTAVDFKIVGFDAPANTGHTVPRFIAILIPLLNAVGWYSGVGFRDRPPSARPSSTLMPPRRTSCNESRYMKRSPRSILSAIGGIGGSPCRSFSRARA